MAFVRRAFTLIELLIVVAVFVMLASLLFPVFVEAKTSAQRVTCIANFKNASSAATLYQEDYDDRFMPVNHYPGQIPDSRHDRTWVQLILPYAKSFSIFQCPSDTSDRPKAELMFDQDLVVGERFSEFYTASLRSNIGYNYLYLAPIVSTDFGWMAQPRSGSDVVEPSRTLLFIDSLWSRKQTGEPYGGGNWLVVPPCRYETSSGETIDSFRFSDSDPSVYFSLSKGWTLDEQASSYVYGGAWPWHKGKMTVARMDGSVTLQTPAQLAAGCDLQGYWNGLIVDELAYPWDLN